MNIQKIGDQIAVLRKVKGLTQNELGHRLGVSFQAVSKWERGETLSDTAILVDLARALDTTVDNILTGGEAVINFRGKRKVEDIIKGIRCLEDMGKLLGKENIIYRYAVEGINNGMNTDIEEGFSDDYVFEAFVAEGVIQALKSGVYVDPSDVRKNFRHEHFRDIVLGECLRYGIK